MYRKILIVILSLMLLPSAFYGQSKRRYMLGGGGTNYSNRPLDHNGLRTGMYGDIHNLFGGYIDGSYSTFLSSMPNVSLSPGGYGLGIGLCYDLQVRYFKMQLGIGIRYQNVTNSINDSTFFDSNVVDARGYPYLLRYDFRNRQDKAWNLHAQVPMLFGFGMRHFYFLTGLKFNYTMSVGATSVYTVGETTATYPQYLGNFVEMDNHGLRRNVPVERKGEHLHLKMDVLASFEIGAEWGKEISYLSKYEPRWRLSSEGSQRHEWRMRIALFADYGLLNIMPNTEKDFLYIPTAYKWDFPEYEANHVFSTKESISRSLHNLYAGIKLTILVGSFIQHDCRLCGPWESEVDMANPKIPNKRVRHTGTGR